jgi:hypothetical protein
MPPSASLFRCAQASHLTMKFIYLFLLVTSSFSCRSHSSTGNVHAQEYTIITNRAGDSIVSPGKPSDTLPFTHIYPDAIYEDDIEKAQISKGDSSFFVYNNIRKDYRIFGYQRPDTNSKRLILFSVFTRDVENNPYKCTYGAYYGSLGMNSIQIKFVADKGSFIIADLIIERKNAAKLYFEKKWIEFVD